MESLLPVDAADVSADSTEVVLTVTGMADGGMDGVSVAGVRAASGAVLPGVQTRYFRSGFTPIVFVQTPGAQQDSSQVVGETITVRGVVTAGSGTFGNGEVFIADPEGGEFSGLMINTPPLAVSIGDYVTASGIVGEAHHRTELAPTVFATLNATGTPVPSPEAVTIGQIRNGAPTAEAFEGMLVATSGLVASDTVVAPGHCFHVTDGDDSLLVAPGGSVSYLAVPGAAVHFAGILDFGAAGNVIRPRTTSDMNWPGDLAVEEGAELGMALEPSVPNPARGITTVWYSLARPADVSLKIMSVSGQLVRTLSSGRTSAGRHSATWDGRTGTGGEARAGVYFCRLFANGRSVTRKVVLSR